MSKTKAASKSPAAQFQSSAIVVAAGSSSRMGGKVRKPYLRLKGRPILGWTLTALAKIPHLRQIVLVTRPEDFHRAARVAERAKLPARLRLTFVPGGARRQDSVFNGLKATLTDADLVFIHDAARPFPPQEAMAQAADAAFNSGAAILACKVKDTVKRAVKAPPTDAAVPPAIQTTVPRDGLWLAQTPQVFRRKLILELFERLAAKPPKHEFTDDASICEYFNTPVVLIESSDRNIKVTRPEDIGIAEAFLRKA